jgi:hypothetical protein
MGDKFGRQKILSLTIIILAASTFCIGLFGVMQPSGYGIRSGCYYASSLRASPSAANTPGRRSLLPNSHPTVTWVFRKLAGLRVNRGLYACRPTDRYARQRHLRPDRALHDLGIDFDPTVGEKALDAPRREIV